MFEFEIGLYQMTTVIFTKNSEGIYQGYTCMGHAGYARKGLLHKEPDILCAAISTLAYSTANVLTELVGEEVDVRINEETGFFRCFFKNPPKEKSIFMMEALLLSMRSLAEDYGEQYLQIKFEEV